MFCEIHPDYQAKRRPKVSCFSCWRLYTEAKNLTVEESASMAERNGDRELENWLKSSIDDIIYAPLGGGNMVELSQKSEEAKSAKFSTGFEFLPLEEKKPDESSIPAKGVKI